MWRTYTKTFSVYTERVDDAINSELDAIYRAYSPENVQIVDIKMMPNPMCRTDILVTLIYEIREGDRDLIKDMERS